jgi:hypothetical protein
VVLALWRGIGRIIGRGLGWLLANVAPLRGVDHIHGGVAEVGPIGHCCRRERESGIVGECFGFKAFKCGRSRISQGSLKH